MNYPKVKSIKWRIFNQPGKIVSGRNKESLFFLLGLKITLRTCFESNNFLSNSCPELSNQVNYSMQFLLSVETSFIELHLPGKILSE